uniref:Uncharacterized protein n=1 Tax=Anguilla anguilla TaxID=7936 RepID=A0A0E9TMQ0_ANGAN
MVIENYKFYYRKSQ